MRFALFFELSVPRPFTAHAEERVFANSLAQAELAEELGFDELWVAEHHFLEGYSHSSAPDLFLAACAMRTSRVRLGQGIATCVPEINGPIRLAERAAWLDIISGGRLEFGTGRSSTWTELGGFGADPEATKKAWDEYVEAIPRMWTEERLSFEGVTFSMPERSVLPKPLQKPHPPMWVAVTSPGTEVAAGERGMGCLGLVTGGLAEQERRVARYREALGRCRPVGAFVNDRVNTANYLYCHEDGAEARRVGGRLADAFSSAAAQVLMVKETYPTTTYKAPGLLASLRTEVTTDGARRSPDGLCIGTPDEVAEVVARWEAIGVDCLMFIVNAMEVVPQESVLDSLRLFAREVVPRFRRPGDGALAASAPRARAAGA